MKYFSVYVTLMTIRATTGIYNANTVQHDESETQVWLVVGRIGKKVEFDMSFEGFELYVIVIGSY